MALTIGEAVLPPEVTAEGAKYWSPAEGGCEGINHAEAARVPTLKISRNHELAKLYDSFIPYSSFLTPAEEKNRFLSKAAIMKSVSKSTKLWVSDFVVKYGLCPFAEKVFVDGKIRYKIFMGAGDSEIADVIKFEMLHLMTTPEEDLETTLIVFPFAFPDFEEFYAFSVDLEDNAMPALEALSKPSYTDPSYIPLASRPPAPPVEKLSKLKSVLARKKEREMQASKGSCPVQKLSDDEEIQIAAFHPAFQWAGSEMNEPLNFEKRAPFPTINLLRADRIRQYASEGKTAKIADSNQRSLEEAGAEFFKEVQYYAGVQAGGAVRFRAAVEDATARALAFPLAGLGYIEGTRRVFVKGYPFFLVYRPNEAGIVVFALVHESRRPGYWTSRTS